MPKSGECSGPFHRPQFAVDLRGFCLSRWPALQTLMYKPRIGNSIESPLVNQIACGPGLSFQLRQFQFASSHASSSQSRPAGPAAHVTLMSVTGALGTLPLAFVNVHILPLGCAEIVTVYALPGGAVCTNVYKRNSPPFALKVLSSLLAPEAR